ncbi:hypothetical protein AVEN_203819-1 [Araneus ventricosus]|uniref:RNase H type-1 domain-containing protein n=1 Tax=Araneus ventricosus TaxID=182803 RepID=A0A4Y2HZD6_ARAVE|nr:hypothetical protein AVEN_203819-1 [Araneus ventricosus]
MEKYIQRSFLLSISGAYRTTPTAALQVMLVSHHCIYRSNTKRDLQLFISYSVIFLQTSNHKTTGSSTHLSVHTTQVSLEGGGNHINKSTHLNIFTDGSEHNMVGSAFSKTTWTHQWTVKSKENTVFQAVLLALKEAVNYAITQPPTRTVIHVDNRASIQP